MSPLVSIIIPTYNRAHLICETLDSILAQTYANWECIIVDDGSTDSTENLVAGYVRKNDRFQFIKRSKELPKGGNVCRNIGLKKAKGSYVIFLDSDDVLMNFCLKHRVENIKKNHDFLVFPSKSFLYTPDDAVYIANLLNKPENDINRFLNFDYPWNISATIIKKSFIINEHILWDERLPIHQDLDFYMNILVRAPHYIKVDCTPDVAIRGGEADAGKLSTSLLSEKIVNGKIRYFINTLNYIASLKKNSKGFKLLLYAIALRLGKLLVANNYKSKLFKISYELMKQKWLLLAFYYLPDVIYLKLKNRGPLYKKALKYYPFFYKNRFKYLIIKNSTLAKITLSDYLQLEEINS